MFREPSFWRVDKLEFRACLLSYFMKKCVICEKHKSLNDFRTNSKTHDGKTNVCKKCTNDKRRIAYSKRNNTPWYKVRNAWYSMRSRSGEGHYASVEVRFTKQEFFEWALPIYTRLSEENQKANLSVDRIDPEGHYEFDNIRIITDSENSRRVHQANKIGHKIVYLLELGIELEAIMTKLRELQVPSDTLRCHHEDCKMAQIQAVA
jgi:hypothetical protein